MDKGKATERLNTILSQGAFNGHSNVVSVLEKTPSDEPSLRADTPLHDDPEVPDISLLLQESADAVTGDTMDAIFSKIFASAPGTAASAQSDADVPNQFADMIQAMADSASAAGAGPEGLVDADGVTYQAELNKYYAYEQKKWKARFLVARMAIHLANFYYYYTTQSTFRAHDLGRLLSNVGARTTFFTIFLSIEIVVISSYFAVLSHQGLLQAFSRNHMLSKVQSMAATYVPLVAKYRTTVDTLLVYWGGVSIFIQDLMFLVFLLGMTTFFGATK